MATFLQHCKKQTNKKSSKTSGNYNGMATNAFLSAMKKTNIYILYVCVWYRKSIAKCTQSKVFQSFAEMLPESSISNDPGLHKGNMSVYLTVDQEAEVFPHEQKGELGKPNSIIFYHTPV